MALPVYKGNASSLADFYSGGRNGLGSRIPTGRGVGQMLLRLSDGGRFGLEYDLVVANERLYSNAVRCLVKIG